MVDPVRLVVEGREQCAYRIGRLGYRVDAAGQRRGDRVRRLSRGEDVADDGVGERALTFMASSSAPRRVTPRQQRAVAMRDRLLAETIALLTRHPGQRPTTQQEADAAHVSIGTVYRYFASMESLIDELRTRSIRDITTDLATGVGAALGQDPLGPHRPRTRRSGVLDDGRHGEPVFADRVDARAGRRSRGPRRGRRPDAVGGVHGSVSARSDLIGDVHRPVLRWGTGRGRRFVRTVGG
ncbi:TetR/AcrR family transcriptional regulator [Gordonia humi]|uniref:HTH tetR-type domain-containing protein n=1 Tax=Gordonia humi TaxID=686429 RepID=A0A840F1K7_9ACTN|nr:hypothetical protein [Gordonia humi]